MATSTIKDSTKEEKKTKTSKTSSKSSAKTKAKKSIGKQKKQSIKSRSSKKVSTTTKNANKATYAKKTEEKVTMQIASLSSDSHVDTNTYISENSNQVEDKNQKKNKLGSVDSSQNNIKSSDDDVKSETNRIQEDFIIKPNADDVSHEKKEKVTSLWLNDDIKDEVNVINKTTDEKEAKSVVLDSALATSVMSNNSVTEVSATPTSTVSLGSNVKKDNSNIASTNDSTEQAIDDLNKPLANSEPQITDKQATNESENLDSTQKAVNIQNQASTQKAVNTQNQANTQDTVNAQNQVNTKDTVNTKATENIQGSKDAENVTNIGSTEDVKNIENTNEDSEQQNSVDSKNSSTDDGSFNLPTSTVVTLSNSPKKQADQVDRFNKKLLIPLILSIFAFLSVLIYQYYIKNINYVTPYPDEKAEETQDDNIAVASGSKDYENPINGVYFSNEEASKFKDKKPVAIMVNNHEQARPSYGLSKADVVYEAVAEGGITRLMPIYHSQIPELVESVRSARYYFVELASGYKAHFFHWGGAHVPACQKLPHDNPNYCPPINGKVETNPKVDAYDRIVELGLPNLDGGNYACKDDAPSCAFGRDEKRVKAGYPIEHTAFVRVPLALELAKEIRPDASWHKYIPIVVWKFKDDAPLEERGDIGIDPMISYYYWKTPSAYAVDWKYDKDQNNYIRYQGKVKQVDASNDQELRAKVVVIRFTDEEPVGDKKNHLYHKIVGTGDALIFQDGKVIKAKWNRNTHEDRDVYTDESGNQVEFNRGQIWIQLVPTGNPVTYEPKQPTLQVEGTGNDQDTENNNNDSDNNGETTGQNATDTKTESTNSEPAQ